MDTTSIEGYALFEQAMYALVHAEPDRVGEIADLLELTTGTVQNKANPGQDHQFTLPEYVAILQRYGNLDPQFKLNHLLGLATMLLKLPEMFTDGGFLDIYAGWNEEVGQTHARIRKALADGQVTQTEFDEIALEIDEDIDKELQVKQYLKGLIVPAPVQGAQER